MNGAMVPVYRQLMHVRSSSGVSAARLRVPLLCLAGHLAWLLTSGMAGAELGQDPGQPAASTPPAEVGRLTFEPYVYNTRDGVEITDGELGRLVVPESRSRPGGGTIELAFVRFRSSAPDPGPPIIWLAGGPGDHGSDDIEGPYLELVRAFQRVADVIALDQRGTGLSRPRLDCPEDSIRLPLDRPVTPQEMIEAYRSASRRCARHWEESGVDLTTYNTAESVDDIEDLRRALGAPTISLYGGSYGSHLGLAVIRRYGARVHCAVLSGIEGPDQTWKLPSDLSEHFAEISRLAAEDPGLRAVIPDLLGLMRRVTARLDQRPETGVFVDGEGDSVHVALSGFDLRMANRYFMGSRENIEQLPLIYHALDRGDLSMLARAAAGFRNESVGLAMTYCMDCASGASAGRLERIERERRSPTSLIGEALDFPFPQVCDA